MAEQSREMELWYIWREHVDFYKLLGAGILILIGILIGRVTYPGEEWAFGMNLYTEIVGIALTVGIIEWFNRRRALRQYQQQLVDDTASLSNEIAKNAVHQISRKEWLVGEKGLLQGAFLDGANLRKANLEGANLREADLVQVDLQQAYLNAADLQGADLGGANLRGAKLGDAILQGANLGGAALIKAELWECNLQDASLDYANLHKADMRYAELNKASLKHARLQQANLSGADLRGSDLTDAHLEGAILAEDLIEKIRLDESTILPDGNYWSAQTDMERFTDTNHVDFWRSDDPDSPADQNRRDG